MRNLLSHSELLAEPLQALSHLLCPPECVWCEVAIADTRRVCASCREKIVSNYYRCKRCATPLPNVLPNAECRRCRDKSWKFERVLTLGPYRGTLREVVIAMKRPSQELLRRAMAQLLWEEFGPVVGGEASGGRPLIVPVPNYWMHPLGGAADAAGSLAGHLGHYSGWDVSTRLVRRIRRTAKQGMLSWSERTRNVRGAFQFQATSELSGRHVILVDDVLTSGATAAELAAGLRRAGAANVWVVVAARGTGAKEVAAQGRPVAQ